MKLSTLKPIFTSQKKDRREVEKGREWYNTKAWRLLREEVFVRDKYTCQRKECGRLIIDRKQCIAHHKLPHKGNEQLFWSKDNLETVCKPCHDGPIASEERREMIWGQWY